MIDQLDRDTNDFLENGTRGDFIPAVSHDHSFMNTPIYRDAQRKRNQQFSSIADNAALASKPLFDVITTPVNSVFDGSPDVVPQRTINRPPTKPAVEKANLANRYQMISQAVDNIAEKG